MSRIRIAVDAMGGDNGLQVTVPAAVQAVRNFADTEIVLVGDEVEIQQQLSKLATSHPRITVKAASERVEMHDLPSDALRNKKDSSMRVAAELVKHNFADGFVSAGNTGALMLTAKFVLKTLPHISKPAICTALPNVNESVYALDLGANVEVSAEQLVEFAIMGIAVAESLGERVSPKVGLLNIGEEEIKGTAVVKDANAILKQLASQNKLNYIGYIEANDLFTGDVEVAVMGGSEGNIALKAAEGSAKLIFGDIRRHAKATLIHRLLTLFALPILKPTIRRLDPNRLNGACLVGLNGIAVKSHGSAPVHGFVSAISVTRKLIVNQAVAKINDALANNIEVLTGNKNSNFDD